jgi:hypothetical protein
MTYTQRQNPMRPSPIGWERVPARAGEGFRPSPIGWERVPVRAGEGFVDLTCAITHVAVYNDRRN